MLKQIANALKSLASSTDGDPEKMRDLMSAGKVGILSSQCCNPSAHVTDKALLDMLESCMEETNTHLDTRLETITAAQKAMGKLGSGVDDAERAIIDQVGMMFQKGGLQIFPILIVDRKVVTFGAAPDREKIAKALLTVDRAHARTADAGELEASSLGSS